MEENVEKKEHQEVGYVIEVKNYLLALEGLPSVKVNDIVVNSRGEAALIKALEKDRVQAMMLADASVKTGELFYKREGAMSLNIGDGLFGSILDGLGRPVGSINIKSTAGGATVGGRAGSLDLDTQALGISSRSHISEQLVTGFGLVDILMPLGKGQRELILGSMNSGKVEFLWELLVNQARLGTVPIYVMLGKPVSFMARFLRFLNERQVADKVILISALSDRSAPMITIAPQTAFSIAEEFCRRGRDVVLVLDDLGTHAKYHREATLLSGQLPGREAYPGDMFYQHASLMERAGSFNDRQGGGTITLLPVIEVDAENYASLVPTNLMASTDGHLFFSKEMFAEGYFPAISVDRSVTRVGHATQTMLQRELASRLSLVNAEYPRHKEYSRFGTQMSRRTRQILKQGEAIQTILDQRSARYLEPATQVMFLGLVFTSLLNKGEIEVSVIRQRYEDISRVLEEDDLFRPARERLKNGPDTTLDDFVELLKSGLPAVEAVCLPSKPKNEN